MSLCNIKTTLGEKPDDFVSADAAKQWIEGHLNPDLQNCGTLPGCRGCVILAGVEVEEMVVRVADKIKSEF